MIYEVAAFLMMFFVGDPVPVESRRKFNLGPLAHGLTTFRSGDWEEVLLAAPPGLTPFLAQSVGS
jgi:hypothetical protein